MAGIAQFEYTHPIRAVLVGVAVTVSALLSAQLAQVPLFVVAPELLAGEFAETSRLARIAFLVLNFLGMAIGGGLYLWLTDRSWSWIDLRRPTKSDLFWVAAGMGLLIVFYVGFSLIVQFLGLPSADSDVILLLQDDVAMILAMVVIVFLFNAPAEEFVFRNIVQKRLYAAFPDRLAVVVASVIFAAVHLPTYIIVSPSTSATLVTLVFLFGGSLLFGSVYVRTRNLVVPIAVHGLLNGSMLLLYLLGVVLNVDPASVGSAALVFIGG